MAAASSCAFCLPVERGGRADERSCASACVPELIDGGGVRDAIRDAIAWRACWKTQLDHVRARAGCAGRRQCVRCRDADECRCRNRGDINNRALPRMRLRPPADLGMKESLPTSHGNMAWPLQQSSPDANAAANHMRGTTKRPAPSPSFRSPAPTRPRGYASSRGAHLRAGMDHVRAASSTSGQRARSMLSRLARLARAG